MMTSKERGPTWHRLKGERICASQGVYMVERYGKKGTEILGERNKFLNRTGIKGQSEDQRKTKKRSRNRKERLLYRGEGFVESLQGERHEKRQGRRGRKNKEV